MAEPVKPCRDWPLEGTRVLRGPDWQDGEADGGEGYLGTVVETLQDAWGVRVVWDMGAEGTYRAPGPSGQHDLLIFDTAPAGIRHPGTQCAECGEKNIFGCLWRCRDCPGCDLCTLCYSDDKHDRGHLFYRIDTPNSRGELQQKRKWSVKIRSIGLHPGAVVVRGKHWMWGDQDGGEGSRGTVKDFLTVQGMDSARNLVNVQWPNGVVSNYRFGFRGYVDLICVEEEIGPYYYRDHLPLLNVRGFSTPNVDSGVSGDGAQRLANSVDNHLRLSLHPDTDRDYRTSASFAVSGTASSAAAAAAAVSTAPTPLTTSAAPPSTSDVTAQTQDSFVVKEGSSGYVTSDEGELALQKVKSEAQQAEAFSVGDRAAIKVGEERLKELQQGVWGGHTARMLRCIGRTGEVTAIALDGRVSVKFGDSSVSYRFNPDVLMKVPSTFKINSTVRILPDCELQKVLSARLEWTPTREEALGKVGRVAAIDQETGDLHVDFNGRQLVCAPASCLPQADDVSVDTLASQAGDKNTERTVSGDDGGGGFGSFAGTFNRFSAGQPNKLFAFIENGHESRVRQMCQQYPELVEAEHHGLTPLIFATYRGQTECVQTLLNLGADVNRSPPDDNRKTPLTAVLEGKCEEIAEILLRHGADTRKAYGDGRTLAHLAVVRDKQIVLRALADHGADFNVMDHNGDTPFHLAIELRRNGAVEILTSLTQVDIYIGNKDDFDVVQLCCYHNNTWALERLLKRPDCTRHDRLRDGDASALHIAAVNDNTECVRLLIIDGGAFVDIRGSQQRTPLHLACYEAKLQTVEAFLELGADVNVHDRDGHTPLHLTLGGHRGYKTSEDAEVKVAYRIQIGTMLISRGAFVDAVNNAGRDPFSYGAREIREGIRVFMKANTSVVQTENNTSVVKAQSLLQSFGVSLPPGKTRVHLKEALRGLPLPCGKCGNKSDVTLEPCGHKCLCAGCSSATRKCPVCDEDIRNKVMGENTSSFSNLISKDF